MSATIHKNGVKSEEALTTFSTRQLRILFVLRQANVVSKRLLWSPISPVDLTVDLRKGSGRHFLLSTAKLLAGFGRDSLEDCASVAIRQLSLSSHGDERCRPSMCRQLVLLRYMHVLVAVHNRKFFWNSLHISRASHIANRLQILSIQYSMNAYLYFSSTMGSVKEKSNPDHDGTC